jgi:hypothetical protein
VEGAHLGRGGQNEAKHTVHVPEDISGRNTQDTEALAPEQRISRSIAPRLIADAMAVAINLNDQAPFEAREVDGHFPDRKLFAELQAVGSLPEHLPQ